MDAHYLDPREIKAWEPATHYPPARKYKKDLQNRLRDHGQFPPNQLAGRHWSIGCVSLEITQRCNLDCTLCYLSENSEAVKDIPLVELIRRIDNIYHHYGPNTDVQVSGGDPTLRNRKELIQIVRAISKKGMRPSLLTNGILASRSMLTDLKEAGLVDVVFHVDLTQERKGFKSEEELNLIREEYIERAKGLGLVIFFNFTVYAGNFHEIPKITQWFIQRSFDVNFVSFQLQADTGRGVLRERDFLINIDTVGEQIAKGANKKLDFDALLTGHPKCNRYSFCLVINGNLYNYIDGSPFMCRFLDLCKDIVLDRDRPIATFLKIIKIWVNNPSTWFPGLTYLLKKVWEMKADLIKARFKIGKITFFMHNFMDASKLEYDRCKTCVFMVQTVDGPISMCVHNAKRDEFVLKPVKMQDKVFIPITGEMLNSKEASTHYKKEVDPNSHALKHLKGRTRQKALDKKNTKDAAP